MTESSKRKVGSIGKDIISELPPNLQETILGFLPIRDAVRTSILSTKWRVCWTRIPHLIFDNRFIASIWDRKLREFKLVTVINKVLLQHNGPILSFYLGCFQYHCDARIIHDYIDQWIPLFSRNGIKQLTIEYKEREEFTAHNFSSLDLTHLSLANVCFPYIPAFRGFTHLTKLELIDVTTSEQRIFSCPVLEKLTLILCDALFHTNFHAPNLKCLHQYYRQITTEYSVAGLENLTEYSFELYDSDESVSQTKTSNVVKVLGSLHKIEKFSIEFEFIKYLAAGGSPNRLSSSLPYLKTLNISCINFNDFSEVSCLFCLIRSAPNLCKLHISAVDYVEGNLKTYLIEDAEDCTLDHLDVVSFSYFRGLKAEMELVKFLLAHSPLLKTMFIHLGACIKKDVALTTAQEMLEYSRALPRAQIRHLKDPVRIDNFGPWVNQFQFYELE